MPKFTANPEWGAHGLEPPAALKNQGFTAGYKPPADYFNWLFYQLCLATSELKTASNASDQNISQNATAIQNLNTAVEGLATSIATAQRQSDEHIDDEIKRLLRTEKSIYGLPLSVFFDENGVPIKFFTKTLFAGGDFSPFENVVKTIFIASNVTSIQGGAFTRCTKLTDVYIDRDNHFFVDSSAFPDGITPHFEAAFNSTEYFVKAFVWLRNELATKATTTDLAALQRSLNAAASDLEDILSHEYFDSFTVVDHQLQMLSNGAPVGDPIPLGDEGSGGLSFDSGYMDENGYFHLTLEGEDIENFTPFYVGTGGGGGGSSGSRLNFSLTSALSFSVAETSNEANVSLLWSSVDTQTEQATGDGSIQIIVNDVLKGSVTVAQGNRTLNVKQYLSSGTNTVKLTLTDAYGVSTTRRCTITVESISLEWNLERTMTNTGNLSITFIPSGVGEKTLYILLDGNEYNVSTVSTSGYRINKRITNLSQGEHIVQAYCTSTVNGSTISSERLVAAIAQIEDNTRVIAASSFIDTEVEQFNTISMPYRVIDPENNPTEITITVNGTPYTTESVGQNEQIFTYRPTVAGSLTIDIICDGIRVLRRVITVTALSIPVSEVTAGLAMKFDPATMVSPQYFTSNGETVQRFNISLSQDFDTINGGLQNDENGIRCFLVKKGDTATIPYELFGDDAKRLGKEIKLIYKVGNCSDYNATAISCMDSGIGLTVKANELRMISELSSIGLQTCEGVRSEIDINIEADTQDRLMKIYEFGSHAQIAQYAQNDNFTQSSAKGITIGSADCDVYVYLIRAYTSPLQNQEVLTNYIFDGADGSIITDRYNKSLIYDETSGRKVATPELAAAVNPDLHVLVWHAPDVSTTKETKITGTLSHIRTSGGAKDKWTVSAQQKVQGTSSVDYIESGANFDFDFKSQISCDDGTTQSGYAMSANSKPVSYFNFKANVASSEHINNILLAEWFNRFQPWKRPARLNDPTVRDTVEGQMAVLFYHNTSDHVVRAGALEVQPDETVFYSLGCLNNSKKNYAVFGQNDDDDIACIELKNNTSDLARFKTYDLTGENFDGEGTYEFRYLAPTANRAEIIASWQSVLRFVCECNPDTATNAPLDPTVTINGTEYIRDNAAYRKARYKAEFNNYFVGQTILYHQLFTLFFCMPDNRGKNLFFGYSKILQKWHLVFGYDFDTAMGNDNVGDLTLRYGYLDTDTIGTKNVYNAADSTLWRLNWECFPDELRSLYIQLENEGCWDAEAFAALCTSYQNKICTALRLEDGIKKYEYPFTLRGIVTFFKMCNGFKILQRLQFLKFQPQFISSFMRSGFCKVNKGTLRGYTPTEFAGVQPKNRLTITPYVDTWVYIEAAQQDVTISNGTKVRAYAGVPVVIDFDQIGSMNDTEISIYNADFIQDIGEIACIYVGECNLSAFERLKYARIGSTNNDYVNTNIKTISLANCKSLEYLNLEGCVFDRDTALDLGSNLMLKELYTRRSNVTGVSLAKGGKAQTVLLNDVASFTAKKLRNLQTLSFASYNNLRTVIIEDCQTIDTLALCQTAGKINRLRLTDIAWTLTTAKLLADLANLSGIDDDGYNTQTAVLTGTCSVNQISEYRYNIISAAFPRLVLDTDTENFVASYTVKFLDYDNTVLDTQIVEYGEAAENPVTRVLNPIKIPTKAATVEKVYTFGGWNGSYNSITENTNITAIYTESTRQYTVNFYNGSELLKTETVDAHGSAYCDEMLSKEGYLWTGYSASTTDVTQDIDAYATFEQPALPEYAKDLSQFDYLYSEDPADAERSAYTMGQIYEICRQKKGKDYFRVGAELKLLPSAQSTLADSMFVFRVFGYNHYKIANTDEFANVVFGMKGLLNAGRRMNPTDTNSGGYPATERVTWENTTFLRCFSLPWQQLFKSVEVLSSRGATSDVIVSATCKLFSFSTAEVGINASTVPYVNEVDAGAETVTFPIFTDNNSRIAKHYNGTGSAGNYFLRSPTPSRSDYFDGCNYSGNYSYYFASDANCVRCGFTL